MQIRTMNGAFHLLSNATMKCLKQIPTKCSRFLHFRLQNGVVQQKKHVKNQTKTQKNKEMQTLYLLFKTEHLLFIVF